MGVVRRIAVAAIFLTASAAALFFYAVPHIQSAFASREQRRQLDRIHAEVTYDPGTGCAAKGQLLVTLDNGSSKTIEAIKLSFYATVPGRSTKYSMRRWVSDRIVAAGESIVDCAVIESVVFFNEEPSSVEWHVESLDVDWK